MFRLKAVECFQSRDSVVRYLVWEFRLIPIQLAKLRLFLRARPFFRVYYTLTEHRIRRAISVRVSANPRYVLVKVSLSLVFFCWVLSSQWDTTTPVPSLTEDPPGMHQVRVSDSRIVIRPRWARDAFLVCTRTHTCVLIRLWPSRPTFSGEARWTELTNSPH